MMDSHSSRKRQHVEDDAPIAAKKRVLASSNGTPHVNGKIIEQPDEPRDGENLELFRKEAIFRRMKHYSRENDRSQIRIAELERRKSTCEAGMAAMSACWNQLVHTVRLLTKPEDLPQVDDETKDILNLALHVSEDSFTGLQEALTDASDATHHLVSKFVQLRGEASLDVLRDNAYVKAQLLQTECATLRSEVDILRVKLEESESDKNQLHLDLTTAETRADRLQSATVQHMHSSQHINHHSGEEEKAEPGSGSALAPITTNGHVHDKDESGQLVAARDQTILELETEIIALRAVNDKIKLSLPPAFADFEAISRSPHFQLLSETAARWRSEAEAGYAELAQLKSEHALLQSMHTEVMENTNVATTSQILEYKTALNKCEAQNMRLRDQREQLNAEITERRNRDNVKMASAQELKTLADSRQDRISVLQSEVVRLKAQLAADAGDKDLMQFFFAEDGKYVEDLRQQLRAARDRIDALEKSLSALEVQSPELVEHVKAEADTLQQLAQANAELDKYRVVYGESSTADVQSLSHALRTKEDEIERLRIRETNDSQAKDLLYAEMDKLSAAWETLDAQVKRKVFDLSGMEERLMKVGFDKAKSDNKFFAAMREKDATENERKNIVRNLEKQSKTLDKMLETNKANAEHVRLSELEITKMRQLLDEQKHQINLAHAAMREAKHLQAAYQGNIKQLQHLMNAKDTALNQAKVEMRKMQDGIIRLKAQTQQQAAKLKETSTALTTSAKETALAVEVDNCMKIIKCSTCKQAMRSHILIKCSHTFCKGCLDLRIATRQRKCPTCNLAFAASEVQPVFFN